MGTGEPVKQKTLDRLEKAGWQPGRHIDIDKYIRAYVEDSVPFWIKAREFLAEFGDLVVEYTTAGGMQTVIDFHAADLRKEFSDQVLRACEEIVNRGTLCLVGRYFYGDNAIFVSEGGEIWGGNRLHTTMMLLGRTAHEAVDNIVHNQEIAVLRKQWGKKHKKDVAVAASPLGLPHVPFGF